MPRLHMIQQSRNSRQIVHEIRIWRRANHFGFCSKISVIAENSGPAPFQERSGPAVIHFFRARDLFPVHRAFLCLERLFYRQGKAAVRQIDGTGGGHCMDPYMPVTAAGHDPALHRSARQQCILAPVIGREQGIRFQPVPGPVIIHPGRAGRQRTVKGTAGEVLPVGDATPEKSTTQITSWIDRCLRFPRRWCRGGCPGSRHPQRRTRRGSECPLLSGCS